MLVTDPAIARQTVQAAFSPSSESADLVVSTIDQAKRTINVAAYSFSSEKIANALIDASKRGVIVRIVLDKTHAKRRYDAVIEMHAAGIPLRINHHYAIMHDKYLIVDGNTVETGSFNFTVNAEKHNAENVVIIKKNKALAASYLQNWEKLWDGGEDYE